MNVSVSTSEETVKIYLKEASDYLSRAMAYINSEKETKKFEAVSKAKDAVITALNVCNE